MLNGAQIVPVDLDTDLGPDAGGQHLDPVNDRLRPDISYAGHLQCRVELGDQLFPCHSGPPLSLRPEADNRFVHVDRRRVGRGLGASGLADGRCNFRKAGNYFVLPAQDTRGFIQRDTGIGNRHIQEITFIEWRHELTADAGRRYHCAHEEKECEDDRDHAVAKGLFQ